MTKFREHVDLISKINGQQIKRHSTLMIAILTAILVGNIGIMVGWYLSPDIQPQYIEVLFYIARALIMLVTAAIIVLIIAFKKDKKISDFAYALIAHLYAAFLLAWATTVFCLDLSLGFSLMSYLIVIIFISGIFIIDPVFLAGLEALSFIPILIAIFNDRELFFSDEYFWENMVQFTAILVLTVMICFKNNHIVKNEYKITKRLEELSYIDGLTGLLNERSYIDITEDIDKRIDAGEDVKFAVILMDVNNLKATNDKYGHRYGCSLVVRCGQTLPTIFKSSKLFHVGGDEFVAIVMDEDLDNFENRMKEFDEAMLYSKVKYEDKELIFSVARGYHIKEDGQHYNEVMQIADGLMYENKKYLKEKYNMKGR